MDGSVAGFWYLTGTMLVGSGLYITEGLGVALSIVGGLFLIMSLIGLSFEVGKDHDVE